MRESREEFHTHTVLLGVSIKVLPFPTRHPLWPFVGVAMEAPRVLEALRHFSEPPSWDRLYKIVEIVEDDVGAIDRRGWATKKELSRFSHTANSPKILGRAARHATQRVRPPKHPMDLVEAEELVKRVLVRWLQGKLPHA